MCRPLFCFLSVAVCRAKLHHNAAAVHIPIGLESKHEGVIDIIQNKAITFEGKLGYVQICYITSCLISSCFVISRPGQIFILSSSETVEGEVPTDMKELVAEKRRELIG